MKLLKPMFWSAVVVVIAGSAFSLWMTARDSTVDRRAAYNALRQHEEPSARWHMLLYLDINSCLTCNEDMDAWRELADQLGQYNGEILIFAPREDSLDVAAAMELEGFEQEVHVLSPAVIEDLGWGELGTPVKVLLDSVYQPIEIEGRLGNSKESAWFIESVLKRVRS